MSGAENIAERFAKSDEDEASAKPKKGLFGRRRSEPLLPEAGSGGASLTAVIAVMSFLATLSLAAFIIIASTAASWTSNLKSELTVQVKGADAEQIKTETESALRILNSTDGVLEARASSPEEAAKLLEPWLGKGNIGAYLNVPAIIEVRVTPALRDDLSVLRNRLSAAAPDAELDDHGRWHDRLSAAARSGQILAFLVFLLIMGAACAIAVFAARAGLAANSETVSILHLVGATDAFVANQVQRRFLVIGLRGSFTGLALAILALGLAAIAMRAGGATGVADFVPAMKLGPELITPLIAVPIALCLVTAVTARLTVLKTLGKEL